MKKRKKIEKKYNFVDKPNKEFENYKKGTLIGALLGGMVGLVINKRIILSTIIGGLVGGYIAYEINKKDSDVPSLKKFIKEK